MRLVIDMQGAQSSGSRNRGIGRYVRALTVEMARQRQDREVVLALNGAFPDTVDALRMEFSGLLPSDCIRVWTPPVPCRGLEVANDGRRVAAEATYEAFLSSLQPDVVLVSSLFEGFTDDTVTSIGRLNSTIPSAVILYDLIPLIHSNIYLAGPEIARWYHQKLDHLRRADLLLSISASSGREAVDYLSFPPERVVNISTACNDEFRPVTITQAHKCELERRYGLSKPYVMYTGGIDHRKNIEGLIRAFALLPKQIRTTHQLAVVCSAHESDRTRLAGVAREAGLAPDDLVMTGFVPDADLLALYNGCALFVFPSWHEGFGLPALEAMACGRPTIGANTSSLPEVIGWDEAQFDPRNDLAISELMAKALSDGEFSKKLEQHATAQAKRFSWEKTAREAWNALGQLADTKKSQDSKVILPQGRPRLAVVTPVPSGKSGIADYSAELLPELSRYYEIDVVVQQEEPLTDPWVLANARIRDAEWFRANHRQYDRILYQFGNSHFHSHMFGLLREIPGVVVLHDYFLSGIISHMDAIGEAPGAWSNALLLDHGWSAVKARYTAKDTADVVWTFPCSGEVLRNAIEIIVHSSHSLELACHWHDKTTPDDWSVIPHMRVPAVFKDNEDRIRLREEARRSLGIREGQFLVCSFGHMGRTKLNSRLLDAWIVSQLYNDNTCRLVFVGQNDGGDYGQSILNIINNSQGKVSITGFVGSEDYRRWLMAADVAVQLRTNSRGETSGAILDCWNYAIPTIANAHGGFAHLQEDCLIKIPDDFEDSDLSNSIVELYNNYIFRAKLGQTCRDKILTDHSPRRCAGDYALVIERAYRRLTKGDLKVLSYVSDNANLVASDDVVNISNAISKNFPPQPRKTRWLVDVSELARLDGGTGIQRVVRSLLQKLLLNPPHGVLVEPVYASVDHAGFKYARKFTSRFLGIPDEWCEDDPVEAWRGDTLFILDWNPVILRGQVDELKSFRTLGVQVLAAVYDLLPLLLPDHFGEAASGGHKLWLEALQQLDGAVCISRSVADELRSWMDANGSRERHMPFDIHYFHLGADIDDSVPSRGIPANGEALLASMVDAPTFLMVGTVEPRKGHELVVDAFDKLWADGSAAQLVIVGKQGWLVDRLTERLRTHPELGNRLHWLDGISDEFLDKLYQSATCLIAASEGEGFGLPLIEAARHGVPLIARDIPVFREVAEDNASYFPTEATPAELAAFVGQWIVDQQAGLHIKPEGMKWLTWAQSAEMLGNILLGKTEPYHRWLPGKDIVYWGSDLRFGTQVGQRRGFGMKTTGKGGYLTYGPYTSLSAGEYLVTVSGHAGGWSGREVLDLVCDKGQTLLVEERFKPLNGKWTQEIRFENDKDITDLEIRIRVDDTSDGSIEEIRIERLQSA